MKHLAIIVIVMQVIFVSCNKEDDIIENKKDDGIEMKEPGYFVLTELKNSVKSSTIDSQLKSAQTGFDLGDLKASMQYSFILVNGGDQPVFDIALNTDNPAFTISPGAISLLEGNARFDNTSGSGFIPLISLGIVHGTRINGFGFSDVLPMGANTSVLTITGKTIDGSDTIDISSDFEFTVNAKLMDIKLYAGNKEIDLTKNYDGSSTTLGGLGFMRHYNAGSGNLEIENTGNVDIELTYGSDKDLNGSDIAMLKPNEKKQMEIIGYNFMTFQLDGNGTIADNKRIELGNDGKGYFRVGRN
jgi:hypothetical protein